MKLQSRKNGNVTITGDQRTLEFLRRAVEALEDRHRRLAMQEPEGSPAEKRERAEFEAAQRLRYELERFTSNAAQGKAEVVEMTDASVYGQQKEAFHYLDL